MQASAAPTVLMDALLARSAAMPRLHRWAVDAALMVGFAGFVALAAQVAVRLPWTPVPITGQTFAVLVTGGALGARRGAGALVVYALMGMLAIPVFAPSASALGLQGDWGLHFVFPWKGTAALPWELSSGGYIAGFILGAFLTGHLAQRAWDRKPWGLLAMLAGSALIYVPGILWLWFLIATDWTPAGASRPLAELIPGSGDWDKALRGGLYPFIAGDLMKLYAASLALPFAWALVRSARGLK